MSKYVPQVGDRVRVTIEGQVTDSSGDGDFNIRNANHHNYYLPHPSYVSVEKIEPPVEVFKPGDKVRFKGTDTAVYLILQDHRVADIKDGWVSSKAYTRGYFTSTRYEKVE